MICLIFRFVIPLDESMDHTIITILIIYLFIFPIIMLYTVRYALHVFLFMLAFISGFYGFYHHSIDDHSITNALYFTFRLYLLDFADVFTSDGSSPTHYPVLLEIARWTAASYTISTIFIAMYRTLGKEIALFMAQTVGKHHIIFSYNEKSRYLIEDLRRKGERVIVVDEMFSTDTENMLNTMDVITIQAQTHDETIFKETGARKAKSISLFHEKDQDSLYVLMNLEKYARREKVKLALDKLIIHLEDNRYQTELMDFLENVNHFSFPVQVMNVYEEVAKEFWKDHEEIFAKEHPVHLLMVGFNVFGRQLAFEAEALHEKRKVTKDLTITIFDDFAKREKWNDMEQVPFNKEEDTLSDVIAEQDNVFTHIFICLDQDYIDLMEGIELSEIFPTTPIYMNFKDESIEQTFMITTTKTRKTLYSTGIIQDILTKEYLKL